MTCDCLCFCGNLRERCSHGILERAFQRLGPGFYTINDLCVEIGWMLEKEKTPGATPWRYTAMGLEREGKVRIIRSSMPYLYEYIGGSDDSDTDREAANP